MSSQPKTNSSYNSNASASAFGWEFQAYTAIFLAFEFIENLTNIKVEGLVDDVEIYCSDTEPIYVQVKSQEKPEPSTNTLTHLENGLKTLVNASAKSKYSRLFYISNIHNPLKNNQFINYFSNGKTKYSYDELPEKAQELIEKKVNDIYKKTGLSQKDFEINKFHIYTIPFYGTDKKTKLREIHKQVGEFLHKIGYKDYIVTDLLDYYFSNFFHNATTKTIKIHINEILWPIIVKGSLNLSEEELDMHDEGIIDEVKATYSHFIEKASHQFELVTKVINDFNDQKGRPGGKSLSIDTYINNHWENFVDSIPCNEKDCEEILIKIILLKILSARYKLNKIKEHTNFEN